MRLLTVQIAVLILISLQLTVAQSHKAKPNILFIFSDDQMPESIGAYGSEVMKTPNLDRLAARGVLYTHAYNQRLLCGCGVRGQPHDAEYGVFCVECRAVYASKEI